jgi:predicted O-linked N-acetylglucosamine transferase (SPINDLY family)
MSENAFLKSLQDITSGRLSLQDMIAAAQRLAAADKPDLARQLYQIWIGLNRQDPLLFVANFNYAAALSQAGDDIGAEAALREAIQQNPDFAPAYVNLGSALERRGAAGEALHQWRLGVERLTAITGDAIEYKITLLKQISRVMSDNQQYDASEAALLQCLDLNPDQRDVIEQFVSARLSQCKWPIAAHGARRLSRKLMMQRLHPLSLCAYADDPLLQRAAAARYVEMLAPLEAPAFAQDRRNATLAIQGRRLRIGYVSSDLRSHAVGYLMAQLFAEHDASAFEIFVYYCGIPCDGDQLTARIRPHVAHWVDIRAMDDDAAAQRIAEDQIDILIDVNGHTREARLGVFARRPAPIQVNWLGYPGTMGSPFHHYIIADDFIAPEGDEMYFSERVLRLPCYQPNDRQRIVDDTRPSRADVGLPSDTFVFCCFNAAHKITRFTFERWMTILKATPNSVLWLLDFHSETNARLRAHAEAQGVAGDRLVFAPKIQNPKHLARYPLADLFLDTLPYGAHTTASDALWMGVPVLTLAGRAFASRVCGSLVRSAGLPDLVCTTPGAYVEQAILLAGAERARLESYRARLVAGRDTCTLFDIVLLTRKLEALYRHMIDAHVAGQTPQPSGTSLTAYLDAGTAFDHDSAEIGFMPDYRDYYRTALANRHRQSPLPIDDLLWDSAARDAACRSGVGALERAA